MGLLLEDILSRVPPIPLVRFRTVCKRWNTLFGDKTFINNHKMSTFQFILVTKSKIYSVSLNPEIELRELSLDIPGLISQTPNDLADCNELLLFGMNKGAVVCNPWLGYDNNDRRTDKIVYKTLVYCLKFAGTYGWKIHDFATYAWKDLVLEEPKQGTPRSNSSISFHSTRSMSLNGSLNWVHDSSYVRHFKLQFFERIFLDILSSTI
ncbi:hypothetical protein Bca4012_072297 [Brassica carinata]|uniref:F-box domain-containing protein n=3 Tax=Brassica TaxID=3705 RepID=A0A0D3CDK2_BRAOL|nr:hypothetical protein F2Q69_00027737 [Brassica cretica]KAG2270142.1 hypothetical protein Bca52824_064697 [Brassica carinata]